MWGRGEQLLHAQVSQPGMPGKTDMVKPVGKHFRLAGQKPHTNMVMIPIEKVSDKEPFLR